MRKIFALTLALTISSSSVALAFHEIICRDQSRTFSACYLSDATFGDILSSYVNEDGRTTSYSSLKSGESINHKDQNGLAVIKYCTNQKLVIQPGEALVTLFDAQGAVIAQMDCVPAFAPDCADLTLGGLPTADQCK